MYICLLKSRLQTSKFSMTSFYVTSVTDLSSARVYMPQQILYDKFSYDKFYLLDSCKRACQ
jgi:hypothetical protein